MRTANIFFAAAIIIAMTLNLRAQETTQKDNSLWKTENHSFGLFAGANLNYSPVFDDASGWLGAKAGIIIDSNWRVGIAGSALWYDKTLKEVVDDGTYRLQSGYAGLFVEYTFHLSDEFQLALSLTTGRGLVKYEYDKKYRKDKPWYQEVIDRDEFVINEPAVELRWNAGSNWWIGANASYRFTSPLEIVEADEFFLNNYSAGISVSYSIY